MGKFWVEVIESVLSLVVISGLGFFGAEVNPLVTDESLGDWDVLKGVEDVSVHAKIWDWVVELLGDIIGFLDLWEKILDTASG